MLNKQRYANKQQRWILLGIVTMVVVSALVGSSGVAQAHGSPFFPISRVYGCYLEGPENPTNDACQAAKDMNGSGQFYNWNAVSRNSFGAIGEDNGYITDGHLCSAGNAAYKGLDIARDDWPADTLPSGQKVSFRYRATAAHKGTIRFYLTNSTYDPTKTLSWSNLDLNPFATYQAAAQASNGYYDIHNVMLPANRHGRQLIYSVWQRDDPAGETFYGCSDVDLDDSQVA